MIRGFGTTTLLLGALALGTLTLWQASVGCAQAEGDDTYSGCPTPSPRCGDGCVDARLGETCDDGNRLPGDGCNASCQTESGTDVGDTTPPPDDGTTFDDTTPPPDDATTYDDSTTTDTGFCPETPCRLWPQCGCLAGERCTLDDASTETRIVTVCAAAGTGTATSTCTADTDCGVGTGCFGLFSESGTVSMGMCYQYCASGSDCTGVGSVCVPLLTTASTPGTCSHPCDIMTNSGCPGGTKCMPLTLTSTGTLLTDCTSDLGYGTAGSYCTTESQCGIGTFCGSAGGLDECIAYCRNPPMGSCATGLCNSFTEPFVLGGTEYGYCL